MFGGGRDKDIAYRDQGKEKGDGGEECIRQLNVHVSKPTQNVHKSTRNHSNWVDRQLWVESKKLIIKLDFTCHIFLLNQYETI